MARRRKRNSLSLRWISEGIKGIFYLTWRVLPLAVLIAALAGIFFGVRESLYADPGLTVQHVAVVPADGLVESRKRMLQEELLGQHMLEVNLKKIARQLERNLHVSEARVIRQWPSTVRIEMHSRRPVGYIRFAPWGIYGLVTEDGMILETMRQPEHGIKIELLGHQLKGPRTGQKILTEVFQQTVAFLKDFEDHPLAQRERLEKLTVDRLGNTSVFLRGGIEFRLGRFPSRRIEALEKALPLLDSPQGEPIEYIDLQYQDVIVKRK